MLGRILPLRRKRPARSLLESMEARRLLTALLLSGTDANDHIVIAYSAADGDVTVRMAPGYVNGTLLHDVSDVVIDGGEGNDTLEVEVLGVYPYGRPGRPQYTTLRGGNGDDILLGG